ncbi:hypothetical protein [Chamaesiphon sp. VAR_69_metabat_338]|uniref:hypothetical protein n=1 Tax=Chamaesiphon sp. VAR_69_metabat_338 TaxID=2964704 RepID=UPI00286DBE52|nr:hypothetical protein [Chamaesiphon sp. VAR_69_metabat_338]
MGQIEYDSILPFSHLGNKDRSRLKPIDLRSKAPSTAAKVIYKLPTDRSRLKPIDLKLASTQIISIETRQTE